MLKNQSSFIFRWVPRNKYLNILSNRSSITNPSVVAITNPSGDDRFEKAVCIKNAVRGALGIV